MSKHQITGVNRPPRVVEMRAELARKIVAHIQAAGEHATAIPGLTLYRRTAPTPCNAATYEPSLAVFVQGRKRVTLGGTTYLCDESTFLLTSVDVPVVSQIITASEEVPLLSLLLKLDMAVVREILSLEEFYASAGSSQGRGIAIGKTTVELLSACSRLMDLLDAPEDIPFLSNTIEREIVYRLLRGPQGERLRAIATLGDQSHRTSKAIAWLRANFAKPLRVEELAAVARMGISTLHHHFRALTAMSPLQYQKQLRLLPRASECSSTGSMPRLRRSKSGMRARVSSTVSTNASSTNPRCGISKHVGSPGRNNSRINVSTRAGEMGERGRERRLQDDTEHDQPLPPQESQFLLKHVDELVEIAPQLGAGEVLLRDATFGGGSNPNGHQAG